MKRKHLALGTCIFLNLVSCAKQKENTVDSEEKSVRGTDDGTGAKASVIYRYDILDGKQKSYACFYNSTGGSKDSLIRMQNTERINFIGFPLFISENSEGFYTNLATVFSKMADNIEVHYDENRYKNHPRLLKLIEYFKPVLDTDFLAIVTSKNFIDPIDGTIISDLDSSDTSDAKNARISEAKNVAAAIDINPKYKEIYNILMDAEYELESAFLATQFDVDAAQKDKYSGDLCNTKRVTKSKIEHSQVFAEKTTCTVKALSLNMFRYFIQSISISEAEIKKLKSDGESFYFAKKVNATFIDKNKSKIAFPLDAPQCSKVHPRAAELLAMKESEKSSSTTSTDSKEKTTTAQDPVDTTPRPCVFGSSIEFSEWHFIGHCKLRPIDKCNMDSFSEVEKQTVKDRANTFAGGDYYKSKNFKFDPGILKYPALTRCEDVKIVARDMLMRISE